VGSNLRAWGVIAVGLTIKNKLWKQLILQLLTKFKTALLFITKKIKRKYITHIKRTKSGLFIVTAFSEN